jgi:ribonucleoside-diphosphate reductase subunit M1
VCNLASIALNRYVKEDKTFDFKKLCDVTRVITRNLNKIIDINYYPLEEVIIIYFFFNNFDQIINHKL